MFGNSYEQMCSNWVTIKSQQEEKNALCIENAHLEQENDELKKKIDKLEHELNVTKYHLKRVESVARNNVVLHRRELAKMAVESSAKSAVIANLSEAL